MPVPISLDLVVVVKPLMPINSDTISISFSHEPSSDTSTFSRLVYPTGSIISVREPAATTTTDNIDEADSNGKSNGKDAAISIRSISK
ncbi:hypothetical protein Peur_021282 [Populus x canadensis]